MKVNGMMVPKRKKYSCTTTKQDKSLVPSPNLVKDMDINGPDQALCSDMTYIYTEEGFLFLSLMMDMFVHDIVGWAVSETLKTEGWNLPPRSTSMFKLNQPIIKIKVLTWSRDLTGRRKGGR